MNPNIKIVMGVQAGMLVGGLAVWAGTFANSNSQAVEYPKQVQAKISHLVRYANTPIKPENFHCEGIPQETNKPTVGNVLASLVTSNLTTIRNRQSFECFDNTCSLSISDCKPWQSGECSQRFLKYELDAQNRIRATSFSCIDVP